MYGLPETDRLPKSILDISRRDEREFQRLLKALEQKRRGNRTDETLKNAVAWVKNRVEAAEQLRALSLMIACP